jgi:hypothetical protein
MPSIGPLISDLTAPGHDPAVVAPPETASQQAERAARLPRPGWPEKSDMDYLKTLIELGLLLLALPWLLGHLASRPKQTMRKAGEHHIK